MDHDTAIETIEAITAAFDAHDLDTIMDHFADDAVFEGPRGPDPWEQRFVGREAIRAAFAARFAGIPDVRTRTATTSPTAIGACRSGRCPARCSTASAWRSVGATYGRSATTRSS